MDRLPYQVTPAAEAYEQIASLPVTVLLENIRSVYNVGAFFRTADAARAEKICLCGYTARPPHKGIRKTALGADETVAWGYSPDACVAVAGLRRYGYQIAAVETSLHSVDLFDWAPEFPVCMIFGNEVDGITPELAPMADVHVRIPMLGLKHSLNVATAGGVVLYELLRKYRQLSARDLRPGVARAAP